MCLCPVYKRGRLSDRSDSRFVPCGYCSECVRKRKLDWEIRLNSALNWSDCAFFRLLTYDPDHYDFDIYDKEIIRDHIQRFMKRLRRRLDYHLSKLGGKVRLKYFIASEYGETYDRLHYHCLFFIKGAKFTWLEMQAIINSCWPYGIVGNTYNLEPGRIAYAVKYIQKQYNTKFYSRFPISEVAPHLEKQFRTEERYSVYDENFLPSIMMNGKRVSLPYYWMKKLFCDSERWAYRDSCARRESAVTINESILRYNCKLLKQTKFEFDNMVGFSFPEFTFVNHSDIQPNYNFYESNL